MSAAARARRLVTGSASTASCLDLVRRQTGAYREMASKYYNVTYQRSRNCGSNVSAMAARRHGEIVTIFGDSSTGRA